MEISLESRLADAVAAAVATEEEKTHETGPATALRSGPHETGQATTLRSGPRSGPALETVELVRVPARLFSPLKRQTWRTATQQRDPPTVSERTRWCQFMSDYVESLCEHPHLLADDWLAPRNTDHVVTQCGTMTLNHPLLETQYEVCKTVSTTLSRMLSMEPGRTASMSDVVQAIQVCRQAQRFLQTLLPKWMSVFDHPGKKLPMRDDPLWSTLYLEAIWHLLCAITQTQAVRCEALELGPFDDKDEKEGTTNCENAVSMAKQYWQAVVHLDAYDKWRESATLQTFVSKDAPWINCVDAAKVRARIRAWARPMYFWLGYDLASRDHPDLVGAARCYVEAINAGRKKTSDDEKTWSRNTWKKKVAQSNLDKICERLSAIRMSGLVESALTKDLPISKFQDAERDMTAVCVRHLQS